MYLYLCFMTNSIPIRYKIIWTNLYILGGVVCLFIFIVGFFVVGHFMNLFYSLASVVPIYLGFKMKRTPYALVSKSKIQVFGLFGALRYEYTCDVNSRFLNVNNRIIQEVKGEANKVNMNKWFVNQTDWRSALNLFD